MRNLISFLKKERFVVFSIFLLVVSAFIGDVGLLFAEATVVPPETNTATEGREGLQTQQPGQTGSVTNLEEVGPGSEIIAEDIDEDIAKFRSDFFPLDTIARTKGVVQKKRRKNYEVIHYAIDAARISAITDEVYTENTGVKKAPLKLTSDDADVFQQYGTINVKGIDGYDDSGQIVTPGIDLMLYVTGRDGSGMPIVIAINGPKVNATDAEPYVPTIPAGTTLYKMQNACSESQLFCPPSNSTPVPTTKFMQRQLVNTKFTEYFKKVGKKVAWDEEDIIENALWEFRRDAEGTYLFGIQKKRKLNDPAFPNRGPENVYFAGGIWWDIRKFYDYDPNNFTYNDLLGITKLKFTGNNGSKTAFFGAGKDLIERILKIDYKLYKELTISNNKQWGIEMTSFKSTFGVINLVHMPKLDEMGRSDEGCVLDVDNMVRYVMDEQTSRTIDMASQGEEAERNITKIIDCLALKGFSHLIVRPSGSPSGVGTIVATPSANLPATPEEGQVIYLTADAGAFKAGQLLQWNGSAWVPYDGAVYVNAA